MSRQYTTERVTGNTRRFWKAVVEGNTVVYTWGSVGGKTQSKKKVFKGSKSLSANESAVMATERKIRAKLNDDYKLISGRLSDEIIFSKSAVAADLTIPKVMLAQKLPPGLSPMPSAIASVKKVLAQPKLDGNRGLVNIITGEIYSRARKKILSLPGIGNKIARDCKALRRLGIVWVDGELASNEMTFEEIQSIIRKRNGLSKAEARKIKYNVFDYISKDAVEKRTDTIRKLVCQSSTTCIVDSTIIDVNSIELYHDECTKKGYEGAIIRVLGSPYINRRCKFLWKYKKFIDAEFKIVGYRAEKNDQNKLGTFVMKMKDGRTFKARPAATEREKATMWISRRKYLGKKATVKFQGLTSKGKPRFGVIKYIYD